MALTVLVLLADDDDDIEHILKAILTHHFNRILVLFTAMFFVYLKRICCFRLFLAVACSYDASGGYYSSDKSKLKFFCLRDTLALNYFYNAQSQPHIVRHTILHQ